MATITKTCRVSGKEFVITDEDQAFYAKMGVPMPTLCPEERMRRRLANRNERFLYHRKCDLTGKQIISSASADKPYPIYDIDAWWSDKWDATSYGRDFDFNRSFFEQFDELKKVVPRLALQQQQPMENSQYCNCASQNKNCYLVFSTNFCEDCYYGSWINFSKDCVDNLSAMKDELCYETVDCNNCYNVIYGEESKNCSDSAFIKNCIGCKKCLFSWGLKNAEYQIFNKKVSPQEYERILKELNLGSFMALEKAKTTFEEMKKQMTVKALYGIQNENSNGDYIDNCKNSQDVFECNDCEDVSHSNNLETGVKDSMDFSYWGAKANQIYESQACGYDIYNLKFCVLCWSNCHDLLYCDHCFSTKNSFGCVGLKQKEYCILNKQYSKEEYETLLPKIIEHMKMSGEWGEFFPMELSAFDYNETLAQEWLPLTKEETLVSGLRWQEGKKVDDYEGPTVSIPDSINEVTDEIMKQILRCDVTGQLYKVIPQELKFYKKMGLPIPHRHPDQRHKDRMARRRPRILFDRNCGNCGTDIKTTYAPDRPEKVYCETCYLSLVY